MYSFGTKSKQVREELHLKLQEIVNFAINVFDISLICGHRNKEDQDTAYANNRSKVKWPNSKHNSLPSNAVDIYPYPVEWPSLDGIPEEYHDKVIAYGKALGKWYHMGGIMKGVAVVLGIKIKWGGDFKSLFDSPHIELDESEI